jgi:hypothetical protein
MAPPHTPEAQATPPGSAAGDTAAQALWHGQPCLPERALLEVILLENYSVPECRSTME